VAAGRTARVATVRSLHADVTATSGFEQGEHRYKHTVESSDELARFAVHHRPFYEQLHAQRLDVAFWEPTAGS